MEAQYASDTRHALRSTSICILPFEVFPAERTGDLLLTLSMAFMHLEYTQQVGRAPQRPLVWRQDADPQQLGELDVTILQYNILGRCYAMPQWFPGCPPDALDWEKRKSRLVAEIQAYKPVCFHA